jgi:hypothetical protein
MKSILKLGLLIIGILFFATMCTRPGAQITKNEPVIIPVPSPPSSTAQVSADPPPPGDYKSRPAGFYELKDGRWVIKKATETKPEIVTVKPTIISTKIDFGKPMKVDVKSWPTGINSEGRSTSKNTKKELKSPLILNPKPIPIPDSTKDSNKKLPSSQN